MLDYLKQKSIIAGIITIVLIAIFVLVIIPTSFDIRDLRNKIIREKTAIEEQYNRRISTKLTLQRLKILKSEFLDVFTKAYIARGKEIELITKLEEAALKYNLEHKLRLEVNLAAKIGIGTEEQIPLFLEVSGNYINLLNYLNELERADIIIAPISLEIRQSGGGDTGNASARIQAKTFWTKI